MYGFWAEDFFACLTMYPFVCSQLSLQAERVDPVVDVNADPNAHLYAVSNEQPNFKIADPQAPVMQPGPMMMQPLHPSMVPGQQPMYSMAPPPMQGFGGMGMGYPPMGGPMQPMGGMPFNGYA